jgi:Uma2 family endonuclease
MMDIFKRLPEGTLVQLIDNHLVMSPSLLDVHQVAIGEIFLSMATYVKRHRLGKVRIAPYDVYLDEHNAFQPDIAFVSTERMHIIKQNGIYGVPDLIVEILSPATGRYDEHEKKQVYERCGVKEYWIVDPKNKAVRGYELVNNAYRELPVAYGLITSGLLRTSFEF